MTSDVLPVKIREATQDDVSLITSTWLHAFRTAPPVRNVPNRVYYPGQHIILEDLLANGVTYVAVNSDDSNQILGWLCGEVHENALILHFLYVKKPFRRFGIGSKLMRHFKSFGTAQARVFASHFTRSLDYAADTLFEGVVYNPYYIWNRGRR